MPVNEVRMKGGKEERKGAISQRTMLILGRCRCYFSWIQLRDHTGPKTTQYQSLSLCVCL